MKNFTSVRDYAFSDGDKCPESSAAKNWLLNLRTFGTGVARSPASGRYPRERLLCTLPLLLWHADEAGEGDDGHRLRDQLLTDETDWSALVRRYTWLWQQYS